MKIFSYSKLSPFKILFIKPGVNTPVPLLDIPLGILSLSAYIKKYAPFPIQTFCLDLRLNKNPKVLKKTIDSIQPHLIGISLMDSESEFLYKNQSILEEYCHNISFVAGGPFATINYDQILKKTCISLVIVGEGEYSFFNLILNLINGEPLAKVPGLAWRSVNGEFFFNGRAPYIENLDEIPIPDYDLIDLEKYQGYHPNMNGVLAENRYIQIMSSRACPFNCIFCHNIFGKRVRQRSVQHFIKEIKILYYQYNIREFHIIDDYFNFNPKRMHVILDEIVNEGLKIKIAFPNALRGDQLTKKDLILLKQAGTYMITFAIETGSKRIQNITKKRINIQKILQNISQAKKMGIITRGYFMLGFPGESRQELQKTIDLACKSDLSMVSFFSVIPFKNTGLYDWLLEEYPGIDSLPETSFWSKGTYYSKMTGIPLKKIKKRATLRFYSVNRLIWLIKNVPRRFYFVSRFLHSAISILSS